MVTFSSKCVKFIELALRDTNVIFSHPHLHHFHLVLWSLMLSANFEKIFKQDPRCSKCDAASNSDRQAFCVVDCGKHIMSLMTTKVRQ